MDIGTNLKGLSGQSGDNLRTKMNNDYRNKEIRANINKIKCCFFEKINKIDKPLTILITHTKKWEDSNQYN